jgi:hypothetical protein
MKEKSRMKDSTRAKARSKVLLAAFLMKSLLASCTQELSDSMVGSEDGISFRAVMNDMKKTRITDTSEWEGTELLGVFMVSEPTTDSEETADSQSAKYFPVTPFLNLKHSVDVEGKLTNETTTLFSYPLDDSYVKFIAYYPYIEYSQAEDDSTPQSGDVQLLANNGAGMVVAQSYASSGQSSSQSGKAITVEAASGFRTRTSEDDSDSTVGADLALLTKDNLYPIDLSDSRDHDFLYAVSSKSYNRQDKDETVELQFDHMMSKLVLTVKVRYYDDEQNGDSSGNNLTYHDVEADGVKASIFRSTKANFDLLSGVFQNISDTALLAMSASGNSVSSIILPGEEASKVILSYDGHSYTWNTSSINFESGKQYNYTLTLRPRYTDVLISSTITDWENVPDGDANVDEDDFIGNGESEGDGGNNKPGVSGDSDTGTNNSGGSSNGNTSDGNGNGEDTGNGGGTDNGGDTEGNVGGTDNGGDTGNVNSGYSFFGLGVYTSTPELTIANYVAQHSETAVKIYIDEKEYVGSKLGNSSNTSQGIIWNNTGMKNISKISFYAKGYQGSNSIMKIEVKNAKLKDASTTSTTSYTSKSIQLNSDSACTSASNSSFTFTSTANDYYEFDLVNITGDITVTYSVEKFWFVIWGVNYK